MGCTEAVAFGFANAYNVLNFARVSIHLGKNKKMKICPRCQKTYPDDNLNFCLEDGMVLAQSTDLPPATVVMGEPRPTQTEVPSPGHFNTSAVGKTPQPYGFAQPRKSSRAWVWVLLILGGLVVVCGGGFVAILAYIGYQAENASSSNVSSNNRNGTVPASNKAVSNTSAPLKSSSRSDLETVDLEPWTAVSAAFADKTFTGGELLMNTKQKGFYYVQLSPDVYGTDDADTRVTLRNVDDASGVLGYGLVFHSDPQPLQRGYAFLIDAKRGRYRVVRHLSQNENSVITWTNSTAIKKGTAENIIEVRDLDDKIELYINGTMVRTMKNTDGYAGGVPGLYAGDAVKVAFKNLEIRR